MDVARKALRTPDVEEIETQAILAELQIYEDFKDKADKLSSKKRRAKQIAATRNKELIERSDRLPGQDPTNSAKRKRIKPTVSLPGKPSKLSSGFGFVVLASINSVPTLKILPSWKVQAQGQLPS
ncbi:hypothetical protein GS625_16175 [Ruegeria sp. HKCCD7319]|nr:hypothetical protein [Ruegeria sp. HKCCD7319]